MWSGLECQLCGMCDQGLSILLNTCNLRTADKYTEFADHVTCVSLKREEAVPVVNRRSVSFLYVLFISLCIILYVCHTGLLGLISDPFFSVILLKQWRVLPTSVFCLISLGSESHMYEIKNRLSDISGKRHCWCLQVVDVVRHGGSTVLVSEKSPKLFEKWFKNVYSV